MQLLKEHRICRENVYVVGVACDGMCDARMLEERAVSSAWKPREILLRVESLYGMEDVARKNLLLERCRVCKSKKIVLFDELLGEQGKKHPLGTGLRR